jgi:spore coat protein CotH
MQRRIVTFVLSSLLIASASIPCSAQTSDDFFNGDVLHEIRIYINPADYDTFHATNFACKQQEIESLKGAKISPLPRIECHFPIEFHWFFNGQDVTGPQVAISSHGEGSRSNIKPSFKIEFSRYESRNAFLGMKNLVLRADTQDASLMHERLAMALFRKIGIPAPREAHARVYVNDQYAGVYTMVEEVDPVFLQNNFGESDGYLYAYEWIGAWTFNYLGSDSSMYSPLPLKPENHLIDQNAGPIERMIRAINDSPIAQMIGTISNAPDAQFSSAIAQYIDVNALFRELAAENFVAEQDGIIGDYGLNNFYLYRFENTPRSIFIPWDKSNAFWSADWNIFHNFTAYVLTSRAMNVAPDLMGIYLDTLRQMADTAGGPGGWLEQEVLKESQQIRRAVYDDKLKLCDQTASGYLHPCTNDEFEADVARLVQFAQHRPDIVGAQLEKAASPPSSATMAWDAVSGVVGYNLYRADQDGVFTSDPLNVSVLTVPYFTDSTVQSGSTYYYTVRAVDIFGMESPNSNVIQVTW